MPHSPPILPLAQFSTMTALQRLSVNDVVVNEADGKARFNVSLSVPSGKAIAVNYKTADGSARAPGDYTAQNGTLNFAAGETSHSFDVPLKRRCA